MKSGGAVLREVVGTVAWVATPPGVRRPEGIKPLGRMRVEVAPPEARGEALADSAWRWGVVAPLPWLDALGEDACWARAGEALALALVLVLALPEAVASGADVSKGLCCSLSADARGVI